MKNLLSHLDAWLLPYCCIACHKLSDRQQDLCHSCLNSLPLIETMCTQCAHPLPAQNLCGQCRQQTPAFDKTIAAFAYTDLIPHFIQQFKYQHRLVYGRVLGDLLLEQILRYHPVDVEALIPMPLHWWRHLRRGYNQSYLIAKILGKQLGLPVYQQSIYRRRATKIQRSLTKSQRAQNMQHAFHLGKTLPYQRVAIIDDVMTTGHTVNALAQALKQAGATWVEVWVIARTPQDLR